MSDCLKQPIVSFENWLIIKNRLFKKRPVKRYRCTISERTKMLRIFRAKKGTEFRRDKDQIYIFKNRNFVKVPVDDLIQYAGEIKLTEKTWEAS